MKSELNEKKSVIKGLRKAKVGKDEANDKSENKLNDRLKEQTKRIKNLENKLLKTEANLQTAKKDNSDASLKHKKEVSQLSEEISILKQCPVYVN